MHSEKDYDFVTVHGCHDMTCGGAFELAALTGAYTTPVTITSPAPYMMVSLYTDEAINDLGFTAHWTGLVRSYALHALLYTHGIFGTSSWLFYGIFVETITWNDLCPLLFSMQGKIHFV